MPTFDLTQDDPLIATNFFLEIDGEKMSNLTSVNGLAAEINTVDVNERGPNGHVYQHKVMSMAKMTGELQLKRIAPLDSTSDPLWKWFTDLRDKGMAVVGRTKPRRNGSVVLYDSAMKEVSRWNFYNSWPSKIEADGLDVNQANQYSESITLVYEKLERKK